MSMLFGEIHMSWRSLCIQTMENCGTTSCDLLIWYSEVKGLYFVGDALISLMYCSNVQHFYSKTNIFFFFAKCASSITLYAGGWTASSIT